MMGKHLMFRLISFNKRLCSASFFGMLVAESQTTDKPFRKMSDEELIAYNATVPLEQNVICFKDLRTDSHIRKTRCMTIMDILTEAETNARTIDALNIGPQLF